MNQIRFKTSEFRTVACIDCNSRPYQKCTLPFENTRRQTEIVHFVREAAYRKAIDNGQLLQAQKCRCLCVECLNVHHDNCVHKCNT